MAHSLEKNNLTGIAGEAKELRLAALLEGSRKSRIKSIAERYGVKLTDKQTKQQMTEAVLPAIEIGFGIKMKQYADSDLAIAMRCFTEQAIDSAAAAEIMDSAPFRDGVVFVLSGKDRFFAAVPRELAGKLMMHCVSHVRPRDGSALDACAAACAAIYGSFTPAMLAAAANHAYSLGLSEQQAEQYLASTASNVFTYRAGRAVGTETIPFEITAQAEELDYYLPTRKEIETYACYGGDANNYYYRQIVNFIYNNAGVSYDDAKTLMQKISAWCLSDGKISEVFELIRSTHLILTSDRFNYLMSMIGELSAQTHKPCLKGHKPEVVDGLKAPVIPDIQVASVRNEPVRVEPKIGRNDPCPCGSGKKYKKCCGKNK